MAVLKLYAENRGDDTFISMDNPLTYMCVLDSVSEEETTRIWELMTETAPNIDYLWWEKERVGILIHTDTDPDYDALKEIEINEIHCSYVSMKDAKYEESVDTTEPKGVLSSRVSIYTTKDNGVLVSALSDIFHAPFRQL